MLPTIIVIGVGLSIWGFLKARSGSPGASPRIGFSTEKQIGDRILVNLQRHDKAQLHSLISPFPFIDNDAWRCFVEWAQRGKLNTVTENHNLGMYLLNLRQLEQAGLVTNLRQVQQRRKMVVEGVWKVSRAQFLSDPLLQYQAFVAVIEGYIRELMESPFIGRSLLETSVVETPVAYEAMSISLSGLLAVMITCGPYKTESWVINPGDRNYHRRTTEAYINTNGIF